LEAIKKIKEIVPDVTLTIVGSLHEETYYEEIKNKVIELNLQDHVKIKTNISFQSLIQLYEKAEVFVLHSEEESQGIVICEAMAVGLPIVATNVGGIPFILTNGENAYLSNYADIQKFADNILKLLLSRELKEVMAIQNKKTSMQYSWHLIGLKIMQLYTQ
jgi:glycosyltransferase involved in cell wall biosynthesis